MKVNTSALIGKALDWAVENIEIARMQKNGEHLKAWWVLDRQSDPSPYSTDPLLAWPIIHRERIDLTFHHAKGTVTALIWRFGGEAYAVQRTATDPLIAAMCCYVASQQGEEVEISDELLK